MKKGQQILKMAVDAYQKLSPAIRKKLEDDVRKGLMPFLKQNSKRITQRLKSASLMLWQALSDPEVPLKAKVVAVSALVYLVSPFDLICDFLPGGFADDWAALAAGASAVSAIIMAHQKKDVNKGGN
jgi:uncharacterized membrane protein YkvA (DUF1232 family)